MLFRSQAAYPGNSAVSAFGKGQIWIYSEESPTTSDKVYVETSGADAGLFFTTGSATRLQLTGAKWFPAPSFSTTNLQAISL